VFTDIDRLNARDLIAAAGLYRRLQQEGRRILNDPARVQVRFPLLRALYRSGINPFNVYSVEEGDKPERFPVSCASHPVTMRRSATSSSSKTRWNGRSQRP
jgi:hypothetical protein